MIYRMEAKKVLRRVKKISTGTSSRPRCRANTAQRRLLDDLLGLFGGRMSRSWRICRDPEADAGDVQMAEKRLRELVTKEGAGQMSVLFDHLWQSTFVAAALGLLTLAFRKNAAAVRYSLWFAASVKFLLPFRL